MESEICVMVQEISPAGLCGLPALRIVSDVKLFSSK